MRRFTKMKKTGVFLIFFLCFFAAEMVKSYGIQQDLRENLLRLHIIANSDSAYDRKIKLDVRDRLIMSGSYDIDALSAQANALLHDMNAGYSARVCLQNRYVPQKVYKNVALPEGEYTCIDVILGRGKGENWWCIAYPPLCFTEVVTGEMSESAKKELKKRLSEESLKTILKNENVTYKFKIVEDFQKLMRFLN